MDRIEELTALIADANLTYYNGQPTIGDDEFDALKDELRELDPQNVALDAVGSPVEEKSHWVKTPHKIPMGSQDKVNTIPELQEWARKRNLGDGEFCTQEKLDGISISLNYEAGKLVSAVTRGNGLVGEDICRNALKMKGVASQLPEPFSGSVRGEIVLYKEVWEKEFPETAHSNPRNIASGTARRITGGGQEHLNVICYDLVPCEDLKAETDKVVRLKDLGFDVPMTIYGSVKAVQETYESYEEGGREARPYDIDGLVVKINNLALQKAQGNHGTDGTGNPKGQVALKFAHEMRKSKLLDVTWEVGLTGRITPLAHIEPVKIAGAVISKASLHNISNVQKLGIKLGSEVLVSRRNDVIPFLEKCLSVGHTDIQIPDSCPACESELIRNGEYLECTSDECRVEGNINKWINYLEIENVGPKTITALVEAGLVVNPADLYDLDVEAVQVLNRMGERGAQRIINGIQAKSSGPLWLMLGALNIPNCGRRVFKNIVRAGWKLEDILAADSEQLQRIDGIGSSKARDVCVGIQKKRQLIENLLAVGFKVEVEQASPTGDLDGTSFCFTGKMQGNRKELEGQATRKGAQIRSVSGELTYLVMADPTSTSSKAAKARKLGVKLISEEQFLNMLR